MTGSNILTLCLYGQNRSRYLAEYLRKKGYSADFAGVKRVSEAALQTLVSKHDVIVSIDNEVRSYLEKIDLTGKNHIALNIAYDPGNMYQKMEEEIELYLPLEEHKL